MKTQTVSKRSLLAPAVSCSSPFESRAAASVSGSAVYKEEWRQEKKIRWLWEKQHDSDRHKLFVLFWELRLQKLKKTTKTNKVEQVGPADAADAAPASRWWEVPHWSNGGRDLCAVSLSWIIKVKKSHLLKGETEGTGSCQLSDRGGGALSYPAGQTRGVRWWMVVVGRWLHPTGLRVCKWTLKLL